LRAHAGRSLTDAEKTALKAYVPHIDLQSAVLHEGTVPWYLPRRFIGIVRGRHVYFRRDAYVPGSAEGLELLGHELTHVTQYRQGMTVLKYLWSTRRGYWNSRYEREAFDVQARIRRDLAARALSYSAAQSRMILPDLPDFMISKPSM
jgi:hypothetical protein